LIISFNFFLNFFAILLKTANILRLYIKDEQFIKETQNIVERLIMIAFNLLYSQSEENQISHEAILSILNLINPQIALFNTYIK
jgi:hypothetical protein